jgi:hypothetical protein
MSSTRNYRTRKNEPAQKKQKQEGIEAMKSPGVLRRTVSFCVPRGDPLPLPSSSASAWSSASPSALPSASSSASASASPSPSPSALPSALPDPKLAESGKRLLQELAKVQSENPDVSVGKVTKIAIPVLIAFIPSDGLDACLQGDPRQLYRLMRAGKISTYPSTSGTYTSTMYLFRGATVECYVEENQEKNGYVWAAAAVKQELTSGPAGEDGQEDAQLESALKEVQALLQNDDIIKSKLSKVLEKFSILSGNVCGEFLQNCSGNVFRGDKTCGTFNVTFIEVSMNHVKLSQLPCCFSQQFFLQLFVAFGGHPSEAVKQGRPSDVTEHDFDVMFEFYYAKCSKSGSEEAKVDLEKSGSCNSTSFKALMMKARCILLLQRGPEQHDEKQWFNGPLLFVQFHQLLWLSGKDQTFMEIGRIAGFSGDA